MNAITHARQIATIRRFTLVELILVIVFIGVILSITIPSFDRLAMGSGVDAAAAMLGTQLRACRQHAVTNRAKIALVIYANNPTYAFRPAELTPSGTFSNWVSGSNWGYFRPGGHLTTSSNLRTVTGFLQKDLMPHYGNSVATQNNPVTMDKCIILTSSGRLLGSSSPTLRVGDTAYLNGQGSNWTELTVNPFTARVSISGP